MTSHGDFFVSSLINIKKQNPFFKLDFREISNLNPGKEKMNKLTYGAEFDIKITVLDDIVECGITDDNQVWAETCQGDFVRYPFINREAAERFIENNMAHAY